MRDRNVFESSLTHHHGVFIWSANLNAIKVESSVPPATQPTLLIHNPRP